MLEVSGICKSYGKHRILNGVSFFSRARPVRGNRRNQWLRKDHASVDPGGSPCVQTAGASASMGPRSGEGPGLPLTLRPMFPRRTR